MGTSGASKTTVALSMPNANSAAIKCSMVLTRTPISLVMVVDSSVLETVCQSALTRSPCNTSRLINSMPVLGSAGMMVMTTFNPL